MKGDTYMTSIEYLSLSGPRRFLYRLGNFFKNIPLAIGRFFKKLPRRLYSFLKKLVAPFVLLADAMRYGDWKTRLSFLFFGFGQFFRKDKIRATLYLLYEIGFIVFFILVGWSNISRLGSLGTIGTVSYADPEFGFMEVTVPHDNSFEILLFSILTILFTVIFIACFYGSVNKAYRLQREEQIGKMNHDTEVIKDLVGKNYSVTLLSIPLSGIVIFTVVPMIFMILVAFTNYNSNHLSPTNLIDWVGLNNFQAIFGQSAGGDGVVFMRTFFEVLLWTLIWAFFATFTNYFLGMIVAILINTKGIKLKKVWRTILITTIAVPQFISLLLIQRMLNSDLGVINSWLKQLGIIQQNVHWLNTKYLTNVVIIIVNTWIGVPYTMLICTGLLMNIPTDLYESAKIDGASPARMYMKITLPYMWFVTTPYLISQFVGNINNFNVIYLLSEGSPLYTFSGTNVPNQLIGLGRTDLLITWIYKICMTNVFKDYGTAAVLSILIFVVVATFSLIFYSRSNSIKNEEDFQ